MTSHRNTAAGITGATRYVGESFYVTDCILQQGIPNLSRDHIYNLLQECIIIKDARSCRRVHAYISYSGLDSVTVFSDHLIRIYASCLCLEEADVVFSSVRNPSIHTWNAIISAYATSGNHDRTFELYEKMQQKGFVANKYIFLSLSNACTNVRTPQPGMQVHDQVIRNSLELDLAIGTGIVASYVQCGRLDDAMKLFNSFANRDIMLWSIMITGCYETGHDCVGLNLLDKMQKEGIKPDAVVFVCILKAHNSVGSLEHGQLMYYYAILYGLEPDTTLCNTLIDMYAKYGSFLEIHYVFENSCDRNIVSWNSLIGAYAPLGAAAIDIFERMQEHGIQADKITYLLVLKASGYFTKFQYGIFLHDKLIRNGLESDLSIASAIICMHAKHGRLQEARKVFDKMLNKDTVSWSSMIAGYLENGQANCALELFNQMLSRGVSPIKVTFLYALKACSEMSDVEKGRMMHSHVIKNGLILDNDISSATVDMYARCLKLSDAKKVFDSLKRQDIVSWGIIIAAYARSGYLNTALTLFNKMQLQGLRADKSMYLCVLKICSKSKLIIQGRLIHDQLMRTKYVYDVEINNALIDMYTECSILEDAYCVFDCSSDQNATSWGALLAGCVANGDYSVVFKLFSRMDELDFVWDKNTVLSILSASGNIKSAVQARLVHNYILVNGLDMDVLIGNSLIDMYCKCEYLKEAQSVFNHMLNPDMNTWNLMISGHCQNGQGIYALKIFEKWQDQFTITNISTYSCALKACSVDGTSIQGRTLHHQIMSNSMETNLVVGNTLIDMYAKCGYLSDARKVFHSMECRDEISWGSMITSSSLHHQNYDVLKLYTSMQENGIDPDTVTLSCTLKACGSIGAVRCGMLVHDQVIRLAIEMDLVVSTAVIDMYVKCSSSMEAHRVYDKTLTRNEASWTALISSIVQDGNFQFVRQCMKDMRLQGFKPDGQTYTSILAACSHTGQVDLGNQSLEFMKEVHGISPTIEHINCTVDNLARVGYLHDAEALVQSMPMPPETTGLISLLTACQTYGNLEVGRQCLDEVIISDMNGTGSYIMMANILADAQNWQEVDNVQDIRKCVSAWKKPGQAWLELDDEIHEFTVGETLHFLSDDVKCKVERGRRLMRIHDFVPRIGLVMEINSHKGK